MKYNGFYFTHLATNFRDLFYSVRYEKVTEIELSMYGKSVLISQSETGFDLVKLSRDVQDFVVYHYGILKKWCPSYACQVQKKHLMAYDTFLSVCGLWLVKYLLINGFCDLIDRTC